MNYTLTIILTLAVIAAYFWCSSYVKKQQSAGNLEAKKRWIEQLPSLVSTFGVLGTFLGITIGLIGFDTNDIAGSIPTLLGGLSTAFFTSLAGMIGSLLLSKQVNSAFDEEEKGVSDSTAAASMVVKAIEELKSDNRKQVDAQTQFYAAMTTTINQMKMGIDNISANQVSTQAFSDFQTQTIALQVQLANAQTLLQDGLNAKVIPNIIQLKESSDTIASTVSDVKRLNANVGELMDIETSLTSQMDEVSEKVTKLTDKLHSEVVEIEDSMVNTNKLLEKKFDEFTVLLEKSNTEALVTVMKKVTEEFQKQMNELISKLVKENFDQLNKSVERLNTWQVENKEMITALTQQYKQMADNFGATSDTLSKVGGDTQLLVSDGGKLRQIIDALNSVMVEDTKFVEISTKLADTASLTKDNMQSFDDSTKVLNEWIKKQRNFVDGVNVLLTKLEDISKINDYSEEFWKNTKKGLNDAVGSIKHSIDSLNGEIGELDEHFYNRLNATLSELDTCMQAMIQERR